MNTDISGNEGGGFSFQNAGELNPTVLIEGCRIQNCGLQMLNMTSPYAVDMYIQVGAYKFIGCGSILGRLFRLELGTTFIMSLTKGPVHILGENCPRSNPHMAHMGYYPDPHMYK